MVSKLKKKTKPNIEIKYPFFIYFGSHVVAHTHKQT